MIVSASPAPAPLALPSGTTLCGEVLSWTCPSTSIRFSALIDALRFAELDESVARALQPRHAFSRACRKLSESRIIRQIAENESELTFQFTTESRQGDTFEYTLETLLRLDKQAGIVRCDIPALATLAQEQLDRAIENRNGADITRVIQKLFDRQADLFPIRDQGGVYFVPIAHAAFVDRVQSFVNRVGGKLARFPVPAGTAHGDRSVQDAVVDGLSAMIEEHRAAIANFGTDTRQATFRRSAARIRDTRFKLEAYAELLTDQKARLDREISDAIGELRAKVLRLGEPEPLEAAS